MHVLILYFTAISHTGLGLESNLMNLGHSDGAKWGGGVKWMVIGAMTMGLGRNESIGNWLP